MRFIRVVSTIQKPSLAIAALVGCMAFGLPGCSRNPESSSVENQVESLTVPLDSSVLREPLVNVVLPARSDQKMQVSRGGGDSDTPEVSEETQPARDSVKFVNGGMLVTQPANPNGAGRVTGVKLLVPVEGDFEMNLKWAIRRLDQPTGNGAHGLAIRFLFRNSDAKMIMFGCMSSTRCEQCLVTRVKIADGQKADQTMTPLEFSSGTWTVTRRGPVLDLEVKSEDGEVIKSDVAFAGEGELESTEIWCTRLPKGSGHAETELREVSMNAVLFPAEPVPPSYLRWIRWGMLGLVVVTAGLAYRSRH